MKPRFTSSSPMLGLFTGAVLSALISTAHAAIVFADDFNEPNGTEINGKAPDIGSGTWTANSGTINNGALDTTGAARTIFGLFTGPALSASNPLLLLTIDVTLISHNDGWTGVSLFSGASDERIFLGDPGGSSSTWAFARSGEHVHIAGYSGANTATLSYNYNTGEVALYNGTGTDGTLLGSLGANPSTAGFNLDRVRIANGDGGDIAVSNITVQVIPESSAMLLSLIGFGPLLRRRR